MDKVLFWALLILVLGISVILHEIAHGVMALRFGDPTAKNKGRLTLNPIPHIDPFWTILLPGMLILTSIVFGGGGFIIGGAKQVPINPSRFSNFRAGMFFVSIAGVGVNLLLAVAAGIALRFVGQDIAVLSLVLLLIVWVNLVLMIFNLLPIPPLDGSKVAFAVFNVSRATQDKIESFFSRNFFLFFIIIFGAYYSGAFSYFSRAAASLFTLITGMPISL